MSIRRRLALWLCPELLQIPISTAPPDKQVNAISALLSLIKAYARYLVRHFGEKHGISFMNDDFVPKRMTPAEITKLRLIAPDIPRPIPSTEVEQ